MAYPVGSSQVRIKYRDRVIAYAQGMKLSVSIGYTDIRALGDVYVKGFVPAYVTVQGAFTIADERDYNVLKLAQQELTEALAAGGSGPSTQQFVLEPADGEGGFGSEGDAPTYTVQDVRLTDFIPEVDNSGNLLSVTVNFRGRKVVVS